MKIGILGGTFDPIHEGHLLLARAAIKQFKLDKVLFIPAFIPPHKSARRDMTPAPYRYRMTELALGQEAGFEISDIELNRPEVSYTVDTLRALAEKFKGAELFLILGADAAAQFESWQEPDEIRRLAVLAAAPRPGCVLPENVERLDMPLCPITSSDVRRTLAAGNRPGAGILPHAVLEYIESMKLYGGKL